MLQNTENWLWEALQHLWLKNHRAILIKLSCFEQRLDSIFTSINKIHPRSIYKVCLHALLLRIIAWMNMNPSKDSLRIWGLDKILAWNLKYLHQKFHENLKTWHCWIWSMHLTQKIKFGFKHWLHKVSKKFTNTRRADFQKTNLQMGELCAWFCLEKKDIER